jgi:polysaccharide export outer membrane protein
MKRAVAAAMVCLLLAAGCTPSLRGPQVRSGADAHALMPAAGRGAAATGYVIAPRDTVDVLVYNEPDVSTRDTPVQADGTIALPLIGSVPAAGLTSAALASALRDRYLRYYIDPQVSVSVSQVINVQGDVRKPGLYDLRGATTLLDAIALAGGEDEEASLREVLIIREIEGQRMGALFDLHRIRRGEDPDPAIQAKDVVVVGHSDAKQIRRDLLRAAPVLNVFTVF